MLSTRSGIFYGWFVVFGSALVVFGVAGSQFSFGVFLQPMTEDFGWSRTTLSLAFGTTFMLSGLLRPVAGYMVDRYNPKAVSLSGLALVGTMLLLLPLIGSLVHLYLIFAAMAVGITLATGSAGTKIVSAWFHAKRGVTMGLITGGGSIGAILLVPAASSVVVLLDWQRAYMFLGILLLAVILPAGYFLIKNKPQDVGLEPMREDTGPKENDADPADQQRGLVGRDSTFTEALRTPLFWRLTFGYFV